MAVLKESLHKISFYEWNIDLFDLIFENLQKFFIRFENAFEVFKEPSNAIKPSPDKSFCLKLCKFEVKLVEESTFGFYLCGIFLYLGLYLDFIRVFVTQEEINFFIW